MKVVERYIMRRTFAVFMAALVWTLVIAWTTQVLPRINLVTDNGQSALTFLKVATLILPSIIPIVVPFAVAVAVALTLSTMNSDSELAVINAAGASRWTIVRPILLLALVAAMFSFVIDNGINPYARQKNRQLMAESRADLLSLVIQEGFSVIHRDVIDRSRRHGKSNYGIFDRGLRGIFDLAGVWWLRRRRRRMPKAEEVGHG